MADHQRIHPALDVEAPPTTTATKRVPTVVVPLLPHSHRHCSSTTAVGKDIEKEKVRISSSKVHDHSQSDPLHHELQERNSRTIPRIPPPLPVSSSSCRRCCRPWCMYWSIISILLLLLIIIGATCGILYLIFHPKLPNYSVDSLKISDLRLINLGMTLYAKFDLKITANNPNDNIGIYYEQGGRLSVWYSITNTRLCEGRLPKFYQGHHNKTQLDVALTGQTQYGSTLMNALQQQQQTGSIPLDLKVDAPVAIKLGTLKLKKVRILGKCLLVVDSLTANNLISIKANNCRFKLKL